MIGRRRGRGGGGFFDRDLSTIGFPALQMRVIAQVRRPPPPFLCWIFRWFCWKKRQLVIRSSLPLGNFPDTWRILPHSILVHCLYVYFFARRLRHLTNRSARKHCQSREQRTLPTPSNHKNPTRIFPILSLPLSPIAC